MTPEPFGATKPINQLVNEALELCEQFNARSDPERLQYLADAKRILFTRIPNEPGFAEFKQRKSEFYITYVSLCEYQQRHESAILEERFQRLRPARTTAPPQRNSSLGTGVRGPRTLDTPSLPYPTSPSDHVAREDAHGIAATATATTTITSSSGVSENKGVNGGLRGKQFSGYHQRGSVVGATLPNSRGTVTNEHNLNYPLNPQHESQHGSQPELGGSSHSMYPNGSRNSSQSKLQNGSTNGNNRRPAELLTSSSKSSQLKLNGRPSYPSDSPKALKMPEPQRSTSPVRTMRAENYEISPAILRNKLAVSSVLVLDVRQRSAFEDQHIDAPLIACLDPTYLTSRMTVRDLDDTFVLAPSEEATTFAHRDRVDMIVLYDARSQHVSESPVLQTVTAAFLEAGERAYLLRGGLQAWMLSGNSVASVNIAESGSASSGTNSSTDSEMTRSSHISPPAPLKPPPPVPPPHHLYRPRAQTPPDDAPRESTALTSISALPPAVPSLQARPYQRMPQAPEIYSTDPKPPQKSTQPVPSPIKRTSDPGRTTRPFVPYDPARIDGGYADERPRSGLSSLRVPKLHSSSTRSPSLSPSISPVTGQYPLAQQPAKPGSVGDSAVAQQPSTSAVAAYPPNILKPTGLKNLGNTCYMNCVIQCMLSVPSFVLPFYDGTFMQYINYRSRLGYHGELAMEFAGLVRAMLQPNSRFIVPIGIKQLAGRLRPDDFGGYEQQDCQEFLTFVLDGLHEDLNSNGDKARDSELDPEEEQRREQLGIRVASAIEWERYLKGDTSLIVDLFQGQYLSQLRCTVCANTSTTYNAFSSLSLPLVSPKLLEQHASLRACFDEFVKPEVLDGDNAWHCPRCHCKRRAVKTLRISRLPPILIIHLKRFKRSASGAVNKLETPVDYPLRGLDLTRYWPQLTQGENSQREAQLLSSLPPRGQTPPFVYDLRAVTLHHGTLEGGHYTAVTQKPGHGWFYFDDSSVTPVKEQAAVSKHAYVLFYTRRVGA